MTSLIRSAIATALVLSPSFAFAASASIAGLSSGGVVSPSMQVSFVVLTSGFTNPIFTVTDSFPGGVNSSHITSQGALSWHPNRDDIGSHTITITVSDSLGNSATASQVITVVKAGISVTAPSPSTTVRFGTPVNFSATASGFFTPTYGVEDPFVNSSINSYQISPAGYFNWTPLLKDVGVHKLVVFARDMHGNYASTSQTITVEGLPTVSVTDAPTSVAAGNLLTFTPQTTGFESPTITVTDLFYNGATSTLVFANGKVSWTPVYNDQGVHHFEISATDSAGHQASTKVSVTVGPPAVKPVANPIVQQVSNTTSSAAATTTKAATAYVFKSFLTIGSSGAEVTALQKKLIVLGFLSGSATGYFGQLTRKAVQAFQKSKGLEPLGFVGPGTRAALNK